MNIFILYGGDSLLELIFLGTSAGRPTKDRNATSIMLNLMAERGTLWMFDCGEGTQQQLLKTHFNLAKLESIFITHLHGDHIFGLPGILTSRSIMQNRKGMTVFGPKGIKGFIEMILEVSDSALTYPLRIHEIQQNGIIFQDVEFTIEVRKLNHRIDSYGYRVTEAEKPGKLDTDKLKRDDIPKGPYYARLKKGEGVALDDGRWIEGRDYIEMPVKGRCVAILGDTLPTHESVELAKNADVLVHEATQGANLADKANMRGHSTTLQAAEIAKEAKVKKLIITHISPRYNLEDNETLLDESRAVFPATEMATDLAVFLV